MRESYKDRSIVIISHQERILNIADKVIVISDGEVTRQGSREEILPALMGTDSAVNACSKLV